MILERVLQAKASRSSTDSSTSNRTSIEQSNIFTTLKNPVLVKRINSSLTIALEGRELSGMTQALAASTTSKYLLMRNSNIN